MQTVCTTQRKWWHVSSVKLFSICVLKSIQFWLRIGTGIKNCSSVHMLSIYKTLKACSKLDVSFYTWPSMLQNIIDDKTSMKLQHFPQLKQLKKYVSLIVPLTFMYFNVYHIFTMIVNKVLTTPMHHLQFLKRMLVRRLYNPERSIFNCVCKPT